MKRTSSGCAHCVVALPRGARFTLCYPFGVINSPMRARFALVLLAVAAMMSSARAADLGGFVGAPAAVDCNCGSPMITVYAAEPGVVTRHWAACECRYVPDEPRLQRVVGPALFLDSRPFADPWHRW